MRETEREGEVDRVEADISLFGRRLPVVMVIDGIITFQIVETLRTEVVDIITGKGEAVNQLHPFRESVRILSGDIPAIVSHEVGFVVITSFPIQARQHVVLVQVQLIVGSVINILSHDVG